MTASPAIDNGPAVLIGAYDPTDTQGAVNLQGYAALEAQIGQKLAFTIPQLAWGNGRNADGTPRYQRLNVARLQADRDANRISMLSWCSWDLQNKTDLAYSLRSIVTGQHDAYLVQFAKDAATYGHRFIPRPNHEMNGWWFLWSEQDRNGAAANGNQIGDYVLSWRHMHDLIAPIAPNIDWFWCPNVVAAANGSMPTSPTKLSAFYPGDDYVSYAGTDVYNKAGASNAPWITFEQCLSGYPGWFGNTYLALQQVAPSKPMLLAEVGCNDTARAGDTNPGAGDKPGWITAMYAALPKRFPCIAGIAWYNWSQGANNALTQPPAAATAFGAGIASSPRFLTGGAFPLPVDDQPGSTYVAASTPDKDAQIAAGQQALSDSQQSNAALSFALRQSQNNLRDASARADAAEAALAQVRANLQALVQFGSS